MMGRVRYWSLIAIGTMLVLSPADSGSGRALAASSALTVPAVPGDCVQCSDSMSYCEPGTHDAWNSTPLASLWTRNGGAHAPGVCFEGSCDTRHGPACFFIDAPTAQDQEALRVAVLEGNGEAVGLIAKAHTTSVFLNFDRSAVQLRDCAGGVYLHLPASAALLRSAKEHSTPSAAQPLK